MVAGWCSDEERRAMKSLDRAATRRIMRSSFDGATWRETMGCRRRGGGGRSLTGAVVPRCGAGKSSRSSSAGV